MDSCRLHRYLHRFPSKDDIHEAPPTEHPCVFPWLPESLECLPDTSDSCFLQSESCSMEESCFITFPPCFTASGLTAIKVETSRTEKLLIQHPSMSINDLHNSCPRTSKIRVVPGPGKAAYKTHGYRSGSSE